MSSAAQVKAFSRVSTASRAVANIQAKLTVGRGRDRYEQEADRVAETVVSGISTPVASPTGSHGAQRAPQYRPAAVAMSGITRLVHQKPSERPEHRSKDEEERSRQRTEADAEKVRRRPAQHADKEREPEALQRQEEETGAQSKPEKSPTKHEEKPPQRQDEEQPDARAKSETATEDRKEKVQRQEESNEESQPALQRNEVSETQGKLQLQPEDEEEAQSKDETHPTARDKRLFPRLDLVETKLFENKGGGVPLPEQARIPLEAGMGADFNRVRIHTGSAAVEMSRALKAQAFTHGRDVFFNAGKYEPETTRGKLLLAHELTHVVQQQEAERKAPERGGPQHNLAPVPPVHAPAEKKPTTENHGGTEPGAKPTKENGKRVVPSIVSGASVAPVVPLTSTAADAFPLAHKPIRAESTRKLPSKEPPSEKEVEEVPEKAPAVGELAAQPESSAEAEAPEGAAEAPAEASAAKKKPSAPVGDFLRRASKPAFESKKSGLRTAAAAQKATEPAEIKLAQSEKAVVPPTQESASRSRAGQVEKVDQATAPTPSENEAKARFNSALAQAVPSTLEEVDQFKETGKAQAVGQAVKGVVSADTSDVKSTYQEIESAPPAGSAAPSEDLPAIEPARETPGVDMGEGVVGEVQGEHTDMSEYGAQSDDLLKKEQIKEEHLEMVDEGDLAEAKKERQDVKTKVKEAPAEIKQVEREEKQNVRSELRKEEQQGKQAMQEQRRANLEGARGDQKKTKSAIELKRQQVTDHINGVYEKANSTVKQKLEDLEKKSLADFESGQKQATHAFENNVKRGINAFKTKRYDQVGGGFLWVKDKLLGMDDLPEVKQVFDTQKSIFISAIDALIKNITADNKRVIQECKDIVANARKEIEKYVQGLGPDLKKTGDEALKEMKGKLDALGKKISEKEEELQKKLQARREAAIKAIEDKINKMKEEMSGALARLGKFLLNAMIKFFKWALKKAGYASDQLMGIINKGKEVIQKIVTDPIGFIKNLVKAVRDGIDLFSTNIKKHLVAGLMSWLTGALADVPITLPEKWDLKGILYLILQILGLTWNRIRMKLVKRLGEKVVRIAETTVDIVKRLISEGPMGLWEMLKEKAEEIKSQVMEGIRNWAIVELVKQGIIKLVSFLNPAGAIIQAILAIYNTVMFFVENWQRIVEFVKTTFESIGEIAMGKLSKAAQSVERALGMTVPIILAFLARLLGLSGIGKTVTGIIKKIRKPIDKVVNKVVEFVVKNAKKLVAKVKSGAKALKEKGLALIQWWKKRFSFKDKSGKGHSLFYTGRSLSAKLMMASSTGVEVQKFLGRKRRELGQGKTASFTSADVEDADKFYLQQIKKKEQQLAAADKGSATEKQAKAVDANRKLVEELEVLHAQLAPKLVKLIDPAAGEYPPPKLPIMADNKKASSFTAEYVVKAGGGFKQGITQGTESGKHIGNLDGWPRLQGAKLTQQSQWVRMHLLPHRLGGNAVDSNLTPARGPGSNVPCSHAVEKPAIEAAIDSTPKDRKPIWYKFQIDYHSAPHTAFPKMLLAEFGPYHLDGQGQWQKSPTTKKFPQNPDPPEFVATIPNLNAPRDKLVPTQIKAAASGLDLGFVELVLNVRDKLPGQRFTSTHNLEAEMDKRYVSKDPSGKEYHHYGVEKYPERMAKILSALTKGDIVLK